MKQGLLILVAMAALGAGTARADTDSLLDCGLSVGERQVAQAREAKPERRRASAYRYLPGPQLVKTLGHPESRPRQAFRVRSRLPATITIASLGCTWR
ncbi:MAG: hypothetical protein R3228_05190 [Halioglobus sp.]|nr:hypothetical protein [Halioglobus sp.]